MTALLYVLNVIFASGQVTLGKQYAKMGGKADDFNISKAISGVVAFVIMGAFTGASFHFPTLLFGGFYGIFLCISMFTGFTAIEIGPMALTSIISSFSLVIPLIAGITVWDEQMSTTSVVGVILMLSSIVMINVKKEGKISPKWSALAIITMISNGVCSIIQKLHQICYPQQYRTEFMIFAFLVVLIVLTVKRLASKGKLAVSKTGLCAGVMNGASNYIVLILASTVEASLLFPTVSVTNIIAIWLISRVLFRERLKVTQLVGVIVGLVSIFLLNI